jgi:hypothetical protein
MSTALKYDALFSFRDMSSLTEAIRDMMYALGSFPDNTGAEICFLTPDMVDPISNPKGDKGYIGVVFKSANGPVRDCKRYASESYKP